MRGTRVWRRLVVLPLLIVLAAATAGADGSGTPPRIPTAAPTTAFGATGALFSGALSKGHSCTASVVDSAGGDLILTAAHCVSGTGADMLFVPGYVDGRAPHGVWTVLRAWVDPGWRATQDPQEDAAVLQVAPRTVGARTREIQQVVDGYVLGAAPAVGTAVTVPGYAAGSGDSALSCSSTTVARRGFPGFDCRGYVGGTSGSPFLELPTGTGAIGVVGVIGGRFQGGCFDWRSFSSAFGADQRRLLSRAEAGAPADEVPAAADSGC